MTKIKIRFVDGSDQEYEMTDNEIVYALIGDDFGAPPQSIILSQENDKGEESSISVLYTKERS